MKKSASENQLQESSTNNKRKTNTIVAAKKSKRRLHSVEQDEGLNTADEEEPTPNTIETFDLTAEEREKVIDKNVHSRSVILSLFRLKDQRLRN